MKDDTSTPTPDGNDSPNAFERGKPGTNARSAAEAAIEDLRARGGVFVNAVRATRMPMALTDPNLPGNPIVFANDAFLKLSGYRMEELLGQQPHFMNGPGTDPKDIARFAEVLRSDQDDIIETVQYRKDGSRFVATVLLSAYKDEDGRVLNHFMSWLDVTRRVEAEDEVAELKRVQAALRQSEEKYRTLFETMSQGYAEMEIIRDADGRAVDLRWIELNPTYERLTGMSVAECLGRRVFEVIPDFDQWWVAEYDRIVRGGRPERVEHLVKPLDRWFEAHVYPQGGDRFTVLYEDITDRKQADEALRESEERLSLAIAVGQLASWDWDLKTGKVNWNDRHFLVQGYAIGEVTPSFEAWIARVHPEDREGAVAVIENAKVTRTPYVHEFRTLHPDGTVRWCAARGRFFYEAEGTPYRMIGVMEDMTERKQAEQALRDSERYANTLLAELQHRVRNTLGVVRSIARRTAETSQSAEDMLAHFQGRLDAFSRVQSALTRNPDGKVGLASLIEDELIAHAAREGEQLVIEGPEISLEARTAERVSLAIHELTTNAVKYGALINGSGRLRVSWNTEADDEGRALFLNWKESGVALHDRTMTREGFGMELLRRTLPYDLQGETKVELEPDGLRFELKAPLAAAHG